jgi:hypothetical protein
MKVMGKTITGAASGETDFTAPKDSQSQAKGQKKILCNPAHSSIPLPKIGAYPIFFYFGCVKGHY